MKVSVKKTRNEKAIVKKPLTNLYEMNSNEKFIINESPQQVVFPAIFPFYIILVFKHALSRSSFSTFKHCLGHTGVKYNAFTIRYILGLNRMRNTIVFCYVYMPNYRYFFNEPLSVVICLNSSFRQLLKSNTICDTTI